MLRRLAILNSLWLLAVVVANTQEFIPYFTPISGTTGNNLVPDAEAYWAFEETSGNISDSSGNSQTLIEVGAPPTSSFGIVTNTRTFEDVTHTNYFTLTNNAAFAFSGDFTITAWAQFDILEPNIDDKTIIARGDYSGGTNFSWALIMDSATLFDYIAFYWSHDGVFDPANRMEFNLGGNVSVGAYYFIVLRRLGSTMHLSATYASEANLESDVTSAIPGAFFDDATTNIRIGALEGSTVHDMKGYIDELGIWSRYLNNCEVEHLWKARLNGTFSWPQFNSYPCVN